MSCNNFQDIATYASLSDIQLVFRETMFQNTHAQPCKWLNAELKLAESSTTAIFLMRSCSHRTKMICMAQLLGSGDKYSNKGFSYLGRCHRPMDSSISVPGVSPDMLYVCIYIYTYVHVVYVQSTYLVNSNRVCLSI